MAFYHSILIKNNKKILHGLWGLMFLLMAVGASLIVGSWILFIILLLERWIVFNISLNHFRHLPADYVSTTTTSIIDRAVNKVFYNKVLQGYALALLIIVILNIVYAN